MSKLESTLSVALIARNVVNRLQESSQRLATDVTFNCIECHDTGLVRVSNTGDRYKQCVCQKKQDAQPTKKFF